MKNLKDKISRLNKKSKSLGVKRGRSASKKGKTFELTPIDSFDKDSISPENADHQKRTFVPTTRPVTSSTISANSEKQKKTELDVDLDHANFIEHEHDIANFSLEGDEDESLDALGYEEEGRSYGIYHEQENYSPMLPVLHSSEDLTYPVHKSDSVTDPLTRYLREISRYKLLSPEQEKVLTKALAESGDIEIAKKLVTANLRLVVKIAMEYRYAYSNVLDLIQEGNIGLMKAVSKFDPTKGAKLSYYASWWIRSYILKFILDNFRLVKIGTTSEQKKLFYNLLREKERLLGQGISPDVKLLSMNLGVSEKSVALMDLRMGSSGNETSLDRPLSDDGSHTTFLDTLVKEESPVDEILADAQGVDILKEKLHLFLNTLKDRDREIFEKRLLNEIPPSLQSIAELYGVSRERIRQIEERLIKKLKVYMSEFIR